MLADRSWDRTGTWTPPIWTSMWTRTLRLAAMAVVALVAGVTLGVAGF